MVFCECYSILDKQTFLISKSADEHISLEHASFFNDSDSISGSGRKKNSKTTPWWLNIAIYDPLPKYDCDECVFVGQNVPLGPTTHLPRPEF